MSVTSIEHIIAEYHKSQRCEQTCVSCAVPTSGWQIEHVTIYGKGPINQRAQISDANTDATKSKQHHWCRERATQTHTHVGD